MNFMNKKERLTEILSELSQMVLNPHEVVRYSTFDGVYFTTETIDIESGKNKSVKIEITNTK